MTPNEISEFEKEWLKPYKWDEAIYGSSTRKDWDYSFTS